MADDQRWIPRVKLRARGLDVYIKKTQSFVRLGMIFVGSFDGLQLQLLAQIYEDLLFVFE